MTQLFDNVPNCVQLQQQSCFKSDKGKETSDSPAQDHARTAEELYKSFYQLLHWLYVRRYLQLHFGKDSRANDPQGFFAFL